MFVRYPWEAAPGSILRPPSRMTNSAPMESSFIDKKLQEYDFHPDAWGPIIIRDPQPTEATHRRNGQ